MICWNEHRFQSGLMLEARVSLSDPSDVYFLSLTDVKMLEQLWAAHDNNQIMPNGYVSPLKQEKMKPAQYLVLCSGKAQSLYDV